MEQQSRWPRRQIRAQVNSGPANTLPDRAVSPAANCPAAQQAGCGCQLFSFWEMGQTNTIREWSEIGAAWISCTLCVYCQTDRTHTADARV